MVMIYANPGERMLVWNPRLIVHYLPPKTTIKSYGEGVCISASRLLDIKRIEKLKEDAKTDEKKFRVLQNLERDLGIDLRSKDWKVRLRNMAVKIWKRAGRILGIKQEIVKDIERYEFVKWRDSRSYLPNVTLIGIGLGMLDAMSSDNNLTLALDCLEKGYNQGVKKYKTRFG